jgi:hypothetical protein
LNSLQVIAGNDEDGIGLDLLEEQAEAVTVAHGVDDLVGAASVPDFLVDQGA